MKNHNYKRFAVFAIVILLVNAVAGQNNVVQAQGISIPAQINKSFTPISILSGGVSTLSVTIYNPNSFQLQLGAPAWTDNLVGVQTGLSIANSPNITNNCGGSVAAIAGGTTLSLSGGTVPAQVGSAPGQCTVTVDVTSATAGNLINTIPANVLSSTGGGFSITNTTPASATLNVIGVQSPTLSKSFSPNTMWAGQDSVLTISIKNNDPTHALTQASLTDSLPSNVTIASTPGAILTNCGGAASLTGATTGSGSITLSNATIAASTTCTIAVNVTSSVAGVYTNSIPPDSLQTHEGVTNNGPNPVTAQLNVQDIGVEKSFSPTSFQQGSTSTLTITLQNPSPSNYTAASITDTLPSGLTIAASPAPSTTCGGSLTAATGTASVSLSGGTIPAGSVITPGTCTITDAVTSAKGGITYTNLIPAGALTATGPSGPVTNVIAASATVKAYDAGTGVSGNKGFSPSTITAGGTLRLRINITAPSDTDLTNFSITDNLPGSVTVSNSTPASTSGCGVSAVLTAATTSTSISLTGGTILAGTTCQINVYVTSSTAGAYNNVIRPTDLSDTENRTLPSSIQDTLTVLANSDISVSKAFNPSTVGPGGISTLTITLTNTNASSLTNVTLTDLLPGTTANGIVIAPTPNAGTDCGSGSITATAGTQTISMTGGTVPAQVSGVAGICTIHVDVVGNGNTTTYTNTIQPTDVSGTIPTSGTVINPAQAASADLKVADLTMDVVKGFNPLTVFGGSSSTLSLQLLNPNNVALTGISLTDTMPSGMTIASPANLSVGTCGGTLSGTTGNGSFSFSGGTLAAGANCTLTLSATMNVNGNLTNTIAAGTVTTTQGATNPQKASATLTNLPGASVSKAFAPNPISTGNYSLLTITIQNTGNTPLTGMGLGDTLPGTLPSGLEIVGSPAPAPVNNCGGTLTAVTGTQNISLANGSLAGNSSCTIVVSVTSTIAGSYKNCIPAGALTNDQNASNQDAACDTLVVNGASPNIADPALTKVVDPAKAAIGDTVTFTIVVTDSGTVAADNVVVTDNVPSNLSITSVSSSPRGTVVTNGNTITDTIGTLAATDVITITVKAQVISSTNNPTINTASLTTTSPTDLLPNDTSTATLNIVGSGTGGGGGGGGGNGGNNNGGGGLIPVTGLLPSTGFAPGVVTSLAIQPLNKAFESYGDVWLEIPRLGIRIPIVGVPQTNGTWDISWLANQAGWLQGTAFPSWSGNSVLTGHVYLSNGQPGPFVDLGQLKWGDQVVIHLDGQRYIFQVSESNVVPADDTSVIKHKAQPWLTLITCKDYNASTNTYSHRVAVGAVLVKVEADTLPANNGR